MNGPIWRQIISHYKKICLSFKLPIVLPSINICRLKLVPKEDYNEEVPKLETFAEKPKPTVITYIVGVRNTKSATGWLVKFLFITAPVKTV